MLQINNYFEKCTLIFAQKNNESLQRWLIHIQGFDINAISANKNWNCWFKLHKLLNYI